MARGVSSTWWTLVIFLCLSCWIGGASRLQDILNKAEDDIERKLLNETEANVLRPFLGAVLAVSTSEGSEIRAYGYKDASLTNEMTTDVTVQVGSVTKTFIGVVLAQAVLEDKLSMDDKLSQYLPSIAQGFRYGQDVTLYQLATHTWGNITYADTLTCGIFNETVRTLDLSPEELVELSQNRSFTAPPETFWAYSNVGYIILGLVLETVFNESLETILKTRIVDALGLSNTVLADDGFSTDINGHWWFPSPSYASVACPAVLSWLLNESYPGVDQIGQFESPQDLFDCFQEPTMECVELIDTSNWDIGQAFAAGAIVSTAADMLVFGSALRSGSLFSNPTEGQAIMKRVVTQEMYPGSLPWPGYGLGLIEYTTSQADTTLYGHAGQTLGFATEFCYSDNFVIFINKNSAGSISLPRCDSLFFDEFLSAQGPTSTPTSTGQGTPTPGPTSTGGGCDSVCIGLAVGLPILMLALIIGIILLRTSVKKRKKRKAAKRGNTGANSSSQDKPETQPAPDQTDTKSMSKV